jgi:hypothetical protein
MGVLHAALAWLAAASVVAVVAVGAATATGRIATYRALDVTLLAQAAITALAGLAGAATYAAVGPPRDPLHLLYGAVTAALPLAVRILGQGGTARTLGRWVALAGLVALGATLRSFMTGS